VSIRWLRRLPVPEVVQEASLLDLVERIDRALHGLCQPLTVLQCRLAMGDLIGEPDAMREAIREGLQECARMNQTVGTMRAVLQQVMMDTDGERIR
jgi:hypothetical protein